MTDQTVQALLTIKTQAEKSGAIVDRIEVTLRETDSGTSVQFTARLSPAPLKQDTLCVGYLA